MKFGSSWKVVVCAATLVAAAACSSSSSAPSTAGTTVAPQTQTQTLTKYEKLQRDLLKSDRAYWSTYPLSKITATADKMCQDAANGGGDAINIVTEGLGIQGVTRKSTRATFVFVERGTHEVCPQFAGK